MKRIGTLAVIALVLAGTLQSSEAQGYTGGIYVGGGATLPMGDFGEYAKTGWMAVGGIAYNLSPRIWLQGEGMFGSNGHDDFEGDKTELVGANGGIGYAFGNLEGTVVPYVVGGIGVLSHKYKPADGTILESAVAERGRGILSRTDRSAAADDYSETKMMFHGGAGLYFPRGSYGIFVEARYVSRDDTQFVPIIVGAQVNFGRK